MLQVVGSARFTSGGLFFWLGVVGQFPFLLTFSSHSLYLGIEFEEDLKLILGLFYLFWIFDKFENSFAVCVEKG